MLIFGLLLIAGGVGLYFFSQSQKEKASKLKAGQATTVADVVDTYNQVADGLIKGNYAGIGVKISGIGEAASPLTAEHSGSRALYYDAEVRREYEVDVETKDSNGNLTRSVEKRSETISHTGRHVPFYLADGSGQKILVDMEGAEKVAEKSVDRFDPNPPTGYSGAARSRTLGYRYIEHLIPDGAKLYIVGEVSDKRGELSIVKPTEKGALFVVSVKSEDELVGSAESTAIWSRVAAVALAIIGAIVSVVSFVK
ncbi:MAG: hypothetical protein HY22_10435 [[Candidatus Thermochlorobacteriaceae] bacterium GBChlB]|nr:MAG: hypothetical protein HY22_10435 [[Candidatus Thermochlorobacteriaceae] bacterium GBChlB]